MKKLFYLTLCLSVMTLVLFTIPALCELESIPVGIVISPSTLNVASQGTWVTVHADIAYSLVAGATVTLNGIGVQATFADNCGDLVAKFAIDDIKGIVQPGSAVLTLSGFTRDGTPFSGTDMVRVVNIKANK
jgi:hypothetical protein